MDLEVEAGTGYSLLSALLCLSCLSSFFLSFFPWLSLTRILGLEEWEIIWGGSFLLFQEGGPYGRALQRGSGLMVVGWVWSGRTQTEGEAPAFPSLTENPALTGAAARGWMLSPSTCWDLTDEPAGY